MSVWRMGAGDGLIWNKSLGINGSYHFYNHAISTDGGLTFAPEVWWTLLAYPPPPVFQAVNTMQHVWEMDALI